jgi:outer membrane protein TolC
MIFMRSVCIAALVVVVQGCETVQTTKANKAPDAVGSASVTAVSAVSPTRSVLITKSVEATDFARLIRKGVANAPSTAAASSVLAAAGSRVDSARSAYQPQLSAEGAINSDGDAVPILRLSQIIYDGGRTNKRVALRRTEAEQIYESEVASLSARAFEAVEAIINLDRDQRLQAQAQRNVSSVGSVLDDLQERFDAGAGSVADVLAGKGRLSNAQAAYDQATLDVKYAAAAWVEVFGTQPGVVPGIPAAPTLKSANNETVLARSPRMREAEFQTAVRQQEYELAKVAGRPVMSGILETDFDRGLQARVGVSLPIYQGGLLKSDIATASSRLAETEERALVLRRELERALTQARAETSSNAARVARAREAVRLNEQAVDAAQGQFRLGNGSLLQTLDALRELNDARVRLVRQDAEAKRAEYAILAVTGDILDALGILAPARPAQSNG